MAIISDPKLFIYKNERPDNTDPGHYHILLQPARDGGFHTGPSQIPRRHPTVGFSYFGEVGGLRRIPTGPDAKYVVLDEDNGSDKWREAISPTSESTRVRMSFKQWFSLLAEYGINLSRIFVYPDVEPAHYLFKRVNNSLIDTEYDLTKPNADYARLLRKYIEYAQEKKIVVQISLAGVQTLRADKWAFHPMNGKHEADGTYRRNINGWLDAERGREKFAVMRKPVGGADTEPEKNYETQSASLNWILDASKWAWNVVYELFNEPGGDDHIVEEVDWLVTTAKWLDERLRDRVTNERTHLVSLNAGPNLRNRDNKNIFKRLLFDGETRRARPLIDIYSFHGDQWGGDPGHVEPRPNTALTREQVKAQTLAQIASFYSQPIDAAGNTVVGSPIALICDSDAHYRAQDSPTPYVAAVHQDLRLSYNHRWSETWLSQKKLCDQVKAVKTGAP